LVCIRDGAVASGQLPVASETHWKLAAGNRQLHFRIAIPVHPISGGRGDEFEHKNKVSRFQGFRVSRYPAASPVLKP
jgi:hypothetical protein